MPSEMCWRVSAHPFGPKTFEMALSIYWYADMLICGDDEKAQKHITWYQFHFTRINIKHHSGLPMYWHYKWDDLISVGLIPRTCTTNLFYFTEMIELDLSCVLPAFDVLSPFRAISIHLRLRLLHSPSLSRSFCLCLSQWLIRICAISFSSGFVQESVRRGPRKDWGPLCWNYITFWVTNFQEVGLKRFLVSHLADSKYFQRWVLSIHTSVPQSYTHKTVGYNILSHNILNECVSTS